MPHGKPVRKLDNARRKLFEAACGGFVSTLVADGVIGCGYALADIVLSGVAFYFCALDCVVSFATDALEQQLVEVAISLQSPRSSKVALAVDALHSSCVLGVGVVLDRCVLSKVNKLMQRS